MDERWQRPLLLIDPTADQFASDVLRDRERLRRDSCRGDDLVDCRLVLRQQRPPWGRPFSRRKRTRVLQWTQEQELLFSVAPDSQAAALQRAARASQATSTKQRQSSSSSPSAQKAHWTYLRGMVRVPTPRLQRESSGAALLCGGIDADGGLLYALGQVRPNAHGGLCGPHASASGTLEAAELQLRVPQPQAS